MENSLLRDDFYVNKVKSVISDTKTQYATNVLESNNINDIPLSDLSFDMNDQLFFEILLMNIRGMTISYSSHKKTIEVCKENRLSKKIEKIEKEQNINYELLDT